MAGELGWDDARVERELADWREVARPRAWCPRWQPCRRHAARREEPSPTAPAQRPRRPRDPRVAARPRARPRRARCSWASSTRRPTRSPTARARRSLDELVERGLRLVEDGAAIVDVGGESGPHRHRAVPVEEEIARVVPADRAAGGGRRARVGGHLARRRWRAPRSRPGAAMINDVSGLSDESRGRRLRARPARRS